MSTPIDTRLHRCTEVPACIGEECRQGHEACPHPERCKADLDDMFDTARGIVLAVVVLLLSIAASAAHPGAFFGG
ncbi:hypothetical protein [Caldimonas sp. KR1-144]|uniref:hypothetical protein n=1 Tax=Caldimonas sp. KR1-144 TaxID=3400911 RepID=UPI003C08CA26